MFIDIQITHNIEYEVESRANEILVFYFGILGGFL